MCRRQIILLFIFLTFAFRTVAQEPVELTQEETETYKEQCKQIIHFLEGTLNFLGDDDQMPSEKDIIINESYLKIFKDDEVQVEDDLDENREMPLNKDVQAYLKDVDFFFKKVTFSFAVDKVEQLVNEKGEIYYKVTMNRNLKGVTIDNDTVDNNLVRYAEINLNPQQKDLKIVSLYTTKLNERAEWKYWWDHMADGWKEYFGHDVLLFDTLPFNRIVGFGDSTLIVEKWVDYIETDTFLIQNGDTIRYDTVIEQLVTDQLFTVTDTVTISEPDTIYTDISPVYEYLGRFRDTEKVDISNNIMIGNLEPLSELTNLKEISFANTLIDDIDPLRSLNQLEKLNCSGTPVTDLHPLRYASHLKVLNCAQTRIRDFSMLQYLYHLEELDVANTPIDSLNMLSGLKELKKLNLSGTDISDLSAISDLSGLRSLNLAHSAIGSLASLSSLTGLEYLNIDSTQVAELSPLSFLENLTTLQANHTKINDLTPLDSLEKIHLIYCDNTGIDEVKAGNFAANHENCLVIFNTAALFKWWNDLPETWKKIVTQDINISDPVTKEELHQIINRTELKVNDAVIASLEPLTMLYRLEELNIEDTQVEDLDPLASLKNLKNLNLRNTKVSSLEPLNVLSSLRTVNLENTGVSDLMPLQQSEKLEIVYADGSGVGKTQVLALKKELPDCLIIYHSDDLNLWWSRLNDMWRKILKDQSGIDGKMNRENLQRVVDLKKLTISDNLVVKNLAPLTVFLMLEELTLKNTAVADITPIVELPNLKSLTVTSSPISSLERIDRLTQLEHLNIENTPVEDIEPVFYLYHLKTLNIGGTQVKKLKGIEKLKELESLTINNTKVKNLKPLGSLTKLKELKCFNISVKESKIEDYKNTHPQVEVIYY